MNPATYYSAHFSKREMRVSDTAARLGIDNTPPSEVEKNLVRLCRTVLEPLRARFGPYRITSGYRAPTLNFAIGGSKTSVHPRGCAADGEPLDASITHKEVVDFLIASDIPFDQVILEFNQWVHVGIADEGKEPRREALMIFDGTGYLPYDPNDPRVLR